VVTSLSSSEDYSDLHDEENPSIGGAENESGSENKSRKSGSSLK
jgi:hypothetical protein